METPLNKELVGREFDKWLDWEGGVSNVQDHSINPKTIDSTLQFPISPTSTTHSDFNSSTLKPPSFTATSIADLPTPTHSSSSPETRTSSDFRLSGETLHEYFPQNDRTYLKRKLSGNGMSVVDYQMDVSTPAAKKRPHNIVEKRYRANLNEKIAELRDSVPSLRITKKAKSKDTGSAESEEEDLEGLAPSNKLNKASILTKAVEYIRHLEFRNRRLEEENRTLKERIETLDKVIAKGGNDAQRTAAFTSDVLIEESPTTSDDSSTNKPLSNLNPAKGLIGLPDSWRRLRQNAPQEHYGHIYDTPSESSALKGKWPTRIVLGSLAGLLVMEGFSEPDAGTASREKALFGIPLELLDGWQFLRSPRVYLAAFAQYCRAGGIFPLIKGFAALTMLAFLIFAYLFNSKPSPKQDIEQDTLQTTQAAAPSSPIEVRRRAWSTNMQALQLPHHSFFPEWIALTSEWLKYSLRLVFGSRAYQWLTGRSEDDEAARIKAWDIAIDAQLAGGDVEVSRSRVVLTVFGSGTLPRSPIRLMLKSLHCRVLLWSVGRSGTTTFQLANKFAKFCANREWRRARRLNQQLTSRHPDLLPPYLAALLDMECDEVFQDVLVQRAYNLMYDRPTHEHSDDPLMDVVVEDYAIRSPLDAIAAWRSTCSLRKGLELSMQSSDVQEGVPDHLSLALRIAPPGSAAHTRALAAFAVLGNVNRCAFYARATEGNTSPIDMSAYPKVGDTPVPYLIDSSTPISARPEIANCLLFAKALLILDSSRSVNKVLKVLASNRFSKSNTTILTYATAKHTILRLVNLASESSSQPEDSWVMEQIKPHLPIDNPGMVASDSAILHAMESISKHKMFFQRRSSDVSNDTGYESQEGSDTTPTD